MSLFIFSENVIFIYLSSIAQETTKGDDWGQASEVEEHVGGQALQGQRVLGQQLLIYAHFLGKAE